MWPQKVNDPSDRKPVASPLSLSINKVVGDGYRECFKMTARGLYATARSRYYRPEQVNIIATHRFDTGADPHDNAVMYVLETSDGLKGTLIDAYGQYIDNSISRFINDAEDIRRQIERHDGQNLC